ncbi:hypothetical protein [Pseudanabaena sp. PCC 6802]|uniref:hypothetical protein n=1 Tax=Pseudanabaena sp. PCC 6802 TaxID=118173 RepID=UPI00035DCE64|nr:hypothetical protein [Pseudanabaena sp. PCC 6802]
MATIAITELRPVGSALFSDSESFMDVLTESELGGVNGGLSPIVVYTVAINSWWFVGASAAGLSIGFWTNVK